jgi:hypothetical protein
MYVCNATRLRQRKLTWQLCPGPWKLDELLLQAAAGSRDIPRAAAGGTTVAIDVGQRLMRRTAPVDGMFQQFAIHTTGVGERSIAEPG